MQAMAPTTTSEGSAMARIPEARVLLLLGAQPGLRAALETAAGASTQMWAEQLGQETVVRCGVRRDNVDFDGTHFATLLPDLEPFDVTIDAWRVGEEEPGVDGLAPSLRELAPLIDRERSSLLVGRQLRFFRGSGPVALEFLLARRPDLS